MKMVKSRNETVAHFVAARPQNQPVPIEKRFWEKVKRGSPEQCWEWQAYRDAKGYGVVGVRGSKTEKAHRVAWRLSKGQIPKGKQCCHHCDNPPCCNPNHLFIGTPKDNTLDCIVKGRARYLKGESKPEAKLTNELVRKAKELFRSGVTFADIGRKFGLHYTTIMDAVRGKSWKHLGDHIPHAAK